MSEVPTADRPGGDCICKNIFKSATEHEAGRARTNADALSRSPSADLNPATSHVRTTGERNIKQEQLEDTNRAEIISEIERSGALPGYWLSQSGLLLRVTQQTNHCGRVTDTYRDVAPKTSARDVLKASHDAPYSGHTEAKETKPRSERRYFSDGMRREFAEYCFGRYFCHLRKTVKHRRGAPRQVPEEVIRKGRTA